MKKNRKKIEVKSEIGYFLFKLFVVLTTTSSIIYAFFYKNFYLFLPSILIIVIPFFLPTILKIINYFLKPK